MPSSYLYAINNEGRVFGLSTSGNMWREFMYLGLEFKQLSAVPHFMWAIGGDRQVYVHVHGLDVPIRIKEETYENERWLPLEGFSGRLLPTDRYNFSNQDGTVDRSRDKVKLPSMAWQWEGDWQIETTLDGQPLDHDVNTVPNAYKIYIAVLCVSFSVLIYDFIHLILLCSRHAIFERVKTSDERNK